MAGELPKKGSNVIPQFESIYIVYIWSIFYNCRSRSTALLNQVYKFGFCFALCGKNCKNLLIRMKFKFVLQLQLLHSWYRAVPYCTPGTFRHQFPGWPQSSHPVSAEVTQGTELRQGDCLSSHPASQQSPCLIPPGYAQLGILGISRDFARQLLLCPNHLTGATCVFQCVCLQDGESGQGLH